MGRYWKKEWWALDIRFVIFKPKLNCRLRFYISCKMTQTFWRNMLPCFRAHFNFDKKILILELQLLTLRGVWSIHKMIIGRGILKCSENLSRDPICPSEILNALYRISIMRNQCMIISVTAQIRRKILYQIAESYFASLFCHQFQELREMQIYSIIFWHASQAVLFNSTRITPL
jgi:hypothetical protein